MPVSSQEWADGKAKTFDVKEIRINRLKDKILALLKSTPLVGYSDIEILAKVSLPEQILTEAAIGVLSSLFFPGQANSDTFRREFDDALSDLVKNGLLEERQIIMEPGRAVKHYRIVAQIIKTVPAK